MSERTNDEERTEQREQRQERHEMRAVISEKTPVQMGVMISVYILTSSLIIASVWWAATITEKINTVLANQSIQIATITSVQSDVADLKAWRKVIDTSGSPAAATLLKEVADLKRELEVHVALTEKKQ